MRPNIILINCDDLGYGDLGCYGSTVNETPALDRMAAEGTRCTDFYMASPVCSPSRGAMMTGCYPPRISFGSFDGRGVLFPGQGVGLNPDETTIARALKDVGYATKIVGKWHCGDQPEFLPTRHGFDSYYGIPYSNDMGRQQPDDRYPPLPLVRDETVIQQQPDQRGITERYVEESVRFLRDNADGPFFLYLAHMHVHLPHYPPERFLRESRNGPYGGAVACIDWATDVLLTELKALGIDDDTVVLFTSDNGSRVRDEGGSNAPLRGTKGTTWDGGQRVPLIVRWPGRVPAGAVVDELTSAIDLFPTLVSWAGAALPEVPLDGVDIGPLLQGDKEATGRESFVYYKQRSIEAVRKGRWKLHVRKGDETMEALYDLRHDIGESTDVAGDHPEVIAELRAEIERYRQILGDEASGIEGSQVRPAGQVDNPDTLTHYDPSHPYMIAEYDLKERG